MIADLVAPPLPGPEQRERGNAPPPRTTGYELNVRVAAAVTASESSSLVRVSQSVFLLRMVTDGDIRVLDAQ